MRLLTILALLLWCLALPARALEPPVLTVYAAASLKESVDAVAAAWRAQGGIDLVVSYASTAALAQQVEHGAPADLLLSADREWLDHLQQRGHVDPDSRVDLLGNGLVLVAPVKPALPPLPAPDLAQPASLLAALGADGRLALAEVEAVPAGRYARQALQQLGAWDALQGRLVQGENVRAALEYVARGEAPLGIVYRTDARVEPRVRVLAELPAALHQAIVYPAARLSHGSGDPLQARALLAFLQGAEARRIFEAAGFDVLVPPAATP